MSSRAGRWWMSHKLSIGRSSLAIVLAAALGFSITACELTRFDPPLTSTVGGLTIEQLKLIQADTRLTTDEKRQAIREAVGLPDTDEGNREADFLLNLTLA
ncbi:MAG TPA: hypothetical protein VMV81_00260 [Phycisphaerae bacterium]|nr:hypothetical protein [Phycisphaerae bacterium]